MAQSIEQLQIYKSARSLQDEVQELVRQFPEDQFKGLGADLRRSSADVSRHISGAHRLFNYRLKLDELVAMRREAEAAQEQLKTARELGDTDDLIIQCDSIIAQSWGLSKWLSAKLDLTEVKPEVRTKYKLGTVNAT